MKVISHIIPDIVHGGYDDAASLSLWIDTAQGIAHLCGHSGSMMPLDGPVAPEGAPCFEATGRSGHIAIFTADDINWLRSSLEAALAGWPAAPGHATHDESTAARIREILEEVDLEQESYEAWTMVEEPETHTDLYD